MTVSGCEGNLFYVQSVQMLVCDNILVYPCLGSLAVLGFSPADEVYVIAIDLDYNMRNMFFSRFAFVCQGDFAKILYVPRVPLLVHTKIIDLSINKQVFSQKTLKDIALILSCYIPL